MLFGTDPESTSLVVLAIVASLLLAAGCWFRPEWRRLLVVTAFAMAAFAVLDLREVIHQLDESDTGLASVAGAVATLHVAAAVTAVILARRSRQREAPTAA
jgi:O-antigen ligase